MEILCAVGSQNTTGVQKKEKVYSVRCTLLLFPLKFVQWIFSVCYTSFPFSPRNLPLCVHTAHVCIIRRKTRFVLLKIHFIIQACCMWILCPFSIGEWDAFPGSSSLLLILAPSCLNSLMNRISGSKYLICWPLKVCMKKTEGLRLMQRLWTSRLKLFLKCFCAVCGFVSLASSGSLTDLWGRGFTCFLLQGSVCGIYSQETEVSVAYRIKFRTLNELLGSIPSETAR